MNTRRFYKTAITLDTPSIQVQGETLESELHNDVEVLETYGFTAPAPADVNEGLCVFVNGQSDHGVIVGWFDKKYRPTDIKAGEVCIYSHTGSKILLKNNGDIIVTPSSGKTILNSDLQVNGKIDATGDIKAGAISLQNHVHSGVRAGTSDTGAPV